MIRLSYSDALFLASNLHLSHAVQQALTAQLGQSIHIEAEVADELRDLCLERFDEIGLDERYRPTDSGRKLNELIDKLYL